MTKGGDRTHTNLEFFVLAAVRSGLDSAYDLNRSAGLSVGATIPLLARLAEEGLLSSKKAARRSNQYHLTSRGRVVLHRSWKRLLVAEPKEFEAILRIAYLAALMDPSLDSTKLFLKRAASQRRTLAKQRERQAKSILAEPERQSFGSGHRWLRVHAESVRLTTEATLLSQLATRSDLRDLLVPGTRTPQMREPCKPPDG